MHPNRAFAWQDRPAMLALVREVSLCTIFVPGPALVHVPVTVAGAHAIRFHVARSNRAFPLLDGARALLSCLGPNGYISPDWYGTADQVATWNYLAVEALGPLRRLAEEELIEQLDALAAVHEGRLEPKRQWTRSKMSPGRLKAMVEAIAGFELAIEELRGTAKLGQNRSAAERAAAAAGLAAIDPLLAAWMQSAG